MAIAAGRRLSDRIFGGVDGAKADYNNVPVSRKRPKIVHYLYKGPFSLAMTNRVANLPKVTAHQLLWHRFFLFSFSLPFPCL